MIEITFKCNSIGEANFITAALKAAVEGLRLEQAAPQDAPTAVELAVPAVLEAAPCPVVAALEAQDVSVAAALIEPAAPPTVTESAESRSTLESAPEGKSGDSSVSRADSESAAAAVPEKRGRGRPRKLVPELLVPAAAAPVNIFADPVAGPQVAPEVSPPLQAAPASAALTIQQRQTLFGDVYVMQPEGPHKAIALMQRFGASRVADLKAEHYAEFDNLAARILAGTYDPRSGDEAR